MSAPDRGEMLDRADKALSIRRQCALLCVARAGVYRAKRPANDNDLILMRRIDELFMAYPFYGSRRMTLQLRSEGHDINRKRVQRMALWRSALSRTRRNPRRDTRFIPISCAV